MDETPRQPDRRPCLSVADGYSADARDYEKNWAPLLRPHAHRLLERLPLGGARLVLDAGAGVGTLLADLQAKAPAATVFAADCSPGMLARAPARFPRVLTDLMQAGLAPASFDVVVMAFMLFHLPEPLQGLREARSMLRPGGTAGTITWDAEPSFPAEQALQEELDEAGAAREASAFVNHESVGSPARMHGLFTAAEYLDVRTWIAPFTHSYRAEDFIAVRTAWGRTRRRFESLDKAGRARFLGRVRERLAVMHPSDFVDRATLTYATGRRG